MWQTLTYASDTSRLCQDKGRRTPAMWLISLLLWGLSSCGADSAQLAIEEACDQLCETSMSLSPMMEMGTCKGPCGRITTPGFPNPYTFGNLTEDMDIKILNFEMVAGQAVVIQFDDFDLQHPNDDGCMLDLVGMDAQGTMSNLEEMYCNRNKPFIPLRMVMGKDQMAPPNFVYKRTTRDPSTVLRLLTQIATDTGSSGSDSETFFLNRTGGTRGFSLKYRIHPVEETEFLKLGPLQIISGRYGINVDDDTIYLDRSLLAGILFSDTPLVCQPFGNGIGNQLFWISISLGSFYQVFHVMIYTVDLKFLDGPITVSTSREPQGTQNDYRCDDIGETLSKQGYEGAYFMSRETTYWCHNATTQFLNIRPKQTMLKIICEIEVRGKGVGLRGLPVGVSVGLHDIYKGNTDVKSLQTTEGFICFDAYEFQRRLLEPLEVVFNKQTFMTGFIVTVFETDEIQTFVNLRYYEEISFQVEVYSLDKYGNKTLMITTEAFNRKSMHNLPLGVYVRHIQVYIMPIQPAKARYLCSFFDVLGSLYNAMLAEITKITQPRGIVESPGFPGPVQGDLNYAWIIKVVPGRRILLRTKTLDIGEQKSNKPLENLWGAEFSYGEELPMFDSVFFAEDRTGKMPFEDDAITRYKWSWRTGKDLKESGLTITHLLRGVRPPDIITETNLVVVFFETNIFLEKIHHAGFQIEFQETDTYVTCPDSSWIPYGIERCYKILEHPQRIHWHDAEKKCVEMGGTLPTFHSKTEIHFVAWHMSLGDWSSKRKREAFIGLKRNTKSTAPLSMSWADGSPFTFTAWEKLPDLRKSEPNGFLMENCVILKATEISATWRDALCLYPMENMMLICSQPAKLAGPPLEGYVEPKPIWEALLHDDDCPVTFFQCNSGECIYHLSHCDGIEDCRDGSDEINCSLTAPCGEMSYTCENGNCVDYTRVCDFFDDCGDLSDETFCDTNCTGNEFRCKSGQCIPIKEHCDLVENCLDGSDEEFCVACRKDRFYQCHSGTCIPDGMVCNGIGECGEAEDEAVERECVRFDETRTLFNLACSSAIAFGSTASTKCNCKTGEVISLSDYCVYDKDDRGYLTGCSDRSHLYQCGHVKCKEGYSKCPGSYCIPHQRVCDGVRDCINGEDEDQCDKYICKGRYKCKGEKRCLPLEQMCDGEKQCLNGEDELYCESLSDCPPACICYGHYVNCSNSGIKSVPTLAPAKGRHIDLSYNFFTFIASQDLATFEYLIKLSLAHNQIETIVPGTFAIQENLIALDLSHNLLDTIPSGIFEMLKKLRSLELIGNPLRVIEEGAFFGLVSVPALDISGCQIKKTYKGIFAGLDSLRNLTMRNTQIKELHVDTFVDVPVLERLDLTQNDFDSFDREMFDTLDHLEWLQSELLAFCCFSPSTVLPENCSPNEDVFSSCLDLMSNMILRIVIWCLGSVSALLNISCLVQRAVVRAKPKTVNDLFVLNLNIADGIMGINIMIIAAVDMYYRGNFIIHRHQWVRSILCHSAGVLSFVSSEMSVVLLTLMALDRWYTTTTSIGKKLKMRNAVRAVIVAWVIVGIFAVVPLLPIDYFDGKFYAHNSACIALHLTTKRYSGWEYSLAIFAVCNSISVLVITGCYVQIYRTTKRSSMQARTQWSRIGGRLARKVAMIIGTDLCCWIPVIIMQYMSVGGQEIPSEVYAWVAVVLLPLNSAVNPLLYSISALQPGKIIKTLIKNLFARQGCCASLKDAIKKSHHETSRDVNNSMLDNDDLATGFIASSPEDSIQSLTHLLNDKKRKTNAKDIHVIAQDLARALNFLHSLEIAHGFVVENSIGIVLDSSPKDQMASQPIKQAFLLRGIETESSATPVMEVDIKGYGMVIRRLLQLHNAGRKKLEWATRNPKAFEHDPWQEVIRHLPTIES